MRKKLINEAKTIARHYGHPHLGTLHILLAIAKELNIAIPENLIPETGYQELKGQSQYAFAFMTDTSEITDLRSVMDDIIKKSPLTKKIHDHIQEQLLVTC